MTAAPYGIWVLELQLACGELRSLPLLAGNAFTVTLATESSPAMFTR